MFFAPASSNVDIDILLAGSWAHPGRPAECTFGKLPYCVAVLLHAGNLRHGRVTALMGPSGGVLL
jgi:hypothetical protein